ncbi:MAG: phosphopantothenate/pantothenate synthetase family protein [Candidatus Caldarchaeales archaeon]|nr:phosphopantothenate/pantothenate synthetase family protein [Candidatus Caldarchaeales archaeon]
MLAHGRGEALDYLLGEETTPVARKAIRAATALLLTSERPVISVNGNAAALVGEELVRLSRTLGAPLEVNLFYRSVERVRRIRDHLLSLGANEVLAPEDDVAEIEITAELADGWIPESHTPATYRTTLDKIHSLMKRFGRRAEEVEPCLAAIFYPFEPGEASYKRILNAAKHYLAAYPDIQWAAGLGQKHPGFRTQLLMAKPWLWDELASQVPDSLADSTIIYRGVEECVERIARFGNAGCRHIVLEPYWIEKDRLRDAIEIAGRKIRPYIESL